MRTTMDLALLRKPITTGSIRCAASVLLALLGACTDGDGAPLADTLEVAQHHVSELRAETDAHWEEATAVADLRALQDLEAAHSGMSMDHMDALEDSIVDLGVCAGAPDHDVGRMMGLQLTCASEMDHHGSVVARARSLTAALAEEERHHAEMTELIDDLDSMLDGMMLAHGMSMCGHP